VEWWRRMQAQAAGQGHGGGHDEERTGGKRRPSKLVDMIRTQLAATHPLHQLHSMFETGFTPGWFGGRLQTTPCSPPTMEILAQARLGPPCCVRDPFSCTLDTQRLPLSGDAFTYTSPSLSFSVHFPPSLPPSLHPPVRAHPLHGQPCADWVPRQISTRQQQGSDL
jgi:hypothetical protein